METNNFDPKSLVHTKACFASYMGLWAVEPDILIKARNELLQGNLRALDMGGADDVDSSVPQLLPDGIAIVPISGVMMKARSKFGGASTVDVRRTLRTLARDEEVKAIVLSIDSPGGAVDGTQELFDDISSVKALKPVHAFFSDFSASAAIWASASATSISINATGFAGSIGVYGVLHDSSAMFEAQGVKVHVISTGGVKGSGVQGTEVTDEDLAEHQKMVDLINESFLSALMSGRGLSSRKAKALNTGELFGAVEAKELGLVDKIESMDALLGRIRSKLARDNKNRRRGVAMKAEIDIHKHRC